MRFSVNNFLKDRRLWVISIVIFVLLIAVFDKNNLIEVWKLNQQLKELESQRDYYQQKITQDSTILENLKNNDSLERYAREHYLMKRKGETIYIIKE